MSKTKTPKKVANDPETFARTFLTILDKDDRAVKFAWNDTQRQFHRERTGKDLVLKARQVGISTYVQAEMFRREITKTTRSITLANKDANTSFLREMSDRFWEHCTFNGIQPQRGRSSAVMVTYPDYGSSHTIGTAGSVDVGRAGSFTQFHGSEVAFWKDAEKIMAGAMQGGHPDVILESTPNGAQGYFYEMCMDALSGKSDWKLHFFPWFTNPEYVVFNTDEIIYTEEEQEAVTKYTLSPAQIKWRRMKQRELKHLFPQEYPENPVDCFLVSGGGYFGDIQINYKAPFGTEYDPSHKYTAGLDFGQSGDFTYMPVIDRTDRRMVDFLHINKMSWSLQRQKIKSMYLKWHLSGLRAEKNSIGSPNIEALAEDGVELEVFETTNSSKSAIFSTLYEELDTGLMLLDEPNLKAEMATVVSVQTPSGLWRIEGRDGAHDDCPMGLALAVTAKIKAPRTARSWR